MFSPLNPDESNSDLFWSLWRQPNIAFNFWSFAFVFHQVSQLTYLSIISDPNVPSKEQLPKFPSDSFAPVHLTLIYIRTPSRYNFLGLNQYNLWHISWLMQFFLINSPALEQICHYPDTLKHWFNVPRSSGHINYFFMSWWWRPRVRGIFEWANKSSASWLGCRENRIGVYTENNEGSGTESVQSSIRIKESRPVPLHRSIPYRCWQIYIGRFHEQMTGF